MCAKASEMFPDQNIEWTSNDDGDDIEFYRLRKMNSREDEFLLAYPCPTKPRTFITVPRKIGGDYYHALYIVEKKGKEKYVPRRFTRFVNYIDYKYDLKIARTIEEGKLKYLSMKPLDN